MTSLSGLPRICRISWLLRRIVDYTYPFPLYHLSFIFLDYVVVNGPYEIDSNLATLLRVRNTHSFSHAASVLTCRPIGGLWQLKLSSFCDRTPVMWPINIIQYHPTIAVSFFSVGLAARMQSYRRWVALALVLDIPTEGLVLPEPFPSCALAAVE